MGTHDSELHKVCRIEKDISIFLIWVYPLNFRTTHIRPVHYRLAGSKCSLIEISDNASEETIVTCRDAVMVIERDAGDGIDENPVFGSIIHLIGQSWVESVDSFYDEDRSGFKFQLLSIEFPEPRNKIIFRYIHCFSS